jgi:hypothetical protein
MGIILSFAVEAGLKAKNQWTNPPVVQDNSGVRVSAQSSSNKGCSVGNFADINTI